MGKIEQEARKKTRRKNLQRYILSAVVLAGGIAVAALAPNVFGAMAKMGILPKKRQREFIKLSRDRLVKLGFLKYKNGFLEPTEKGESYLRNLEIHDFKFEKPRHWDGKWRVLIFDIPERIKGLRERLRATLVAIGFVRLQDSVWVFPYDCEDLITLLKADFKISKAVLYMIVETLENDASLKKHFGIEK
ncbi:MAG: hypothetical protein AAB858_01395 [Patescibacteria group bacterium]